MLSEGKLSNKKIFLILASDFFLKEVKRSCCQKKQKLRDVIFFNYNGIFLIIMTIIFIEIITVVIIYLNNSIIQNIKFVKKFEKITSLKNCFYITVQT